MPVLSLLTVALLAISPFESAMIGSADSSAGLPVHAARVLECAEIDSFLKLSPAEASRIERLRRDVLQARKDLVDTLQLKDPGRLARRKAIYIRLSEEQFAFDQAVPDHARPIFDAIHLNVVRFRAPFVPPFSRSISVPIENVQRYSEALARNGSDQELLALLAPSQKAFADQFLHSPYLDVGKTLRARLAEASGLFVAGSTSYSLSRDRQSLLQYAHCGAGQEYLKFSRDELSAVALYRLDDQAIEVGRKRALEILDRKHAATLVRDEAREWRRFVEDELVGVLGAKTGQRLLGVKLQFDGLGMVVAGRFGERLGISASRRKEIADEGRAFVGRFNFAAASAQAEWEKFWESKLTPAQLKRWRELCGDSIPASLLAETSLHGSIALPPLKRPESRPGDLFESR